MKQAQQKGVVVLPTQGIDTSSGVPSQMTPASAGVRGRRPSLQPRSVSFRRFIAQNGSLFLMTLPAVALIFVFAYLPMFGIIVAFKDYRAYLGILGSLWVGFQNFAYLFGGGNLWRITSNTVFMNFLFITCGTCASIGIALLLNELRDQAAF